MLMFHVQFMMKSSLMGLSRLTFRRLGCALPPRLLHSATDGNEKTFSELYNMEPQLVDKMSKEGLLHPTDIQRKVLAKQQPIAFFFFPFKYCLGSAFYCYFIPLAESWVTVGYVARSLVYTDQCRNRIRKNPL